MEAIKPPQGPQARASRVRRFVARHGSRKRTFIAIVLAANLLLGAVLLEAGLRLFCPYLLPGSLTYTRELGLPEDIFKNKWSLLKGRPYDLIIIGDSYVDTGTTPVGWITRLRQATGKRILDLGFSGAAPGQYFGLLDRLRRQGIKTPVMIVLYIGNDFTDEAIYARLGADKTAYFQGRYDVISNPESPLFSASVDLPPWLWLSNHLAIYRAGQIFWGSVKSYNEAVSSSGGVWREDWLRRFMHQRCNKPPWAEPVGGRLYYFRAHDAMVDPALPDVQLGQRRILELLRAHRADPGLTVCAVLDREEVSEGVHGRRVAHAAPFIHKMRETGVKVLDSNQAFVKASRATDLFYADCHWNSDGHALFSAEIKRMLGL